MVRKPDGVGRDSFNTCNLVREGDGRAPNEPQCTSKKKAAGHVGLPLFDAATPYSAAGRAYWTLLIVAL